MVTADNTEHNNSKAKTGRQTDREGEIRAGNWDMDFSGEFDPVKPYTGRRTVPFPAALRAIEDKAAHETQLVNQITISRHQRPAKDGHL